MTPVRQSPLDKQRSTGASPEVVTLSPDWVIANIDVLIDIASDVPGEYWRTAHFLADLPEKWALSFALSDDGVPVAYSIISEKGPDHCHLHHFMVHLHWRSHGLGNQMVTEMLARARAGGYKRLTLKIAAENGSGRLFYRRHGFGPVNEAGSYHLWEISL
jgi:ribosomal protein S18 acetylase RimI-like enzyme